MVSLSLGTYIIANTKRGKKRRKFDIHSIAPGIELDLYVPIESEILESLQVSVYLLLLLLLLGADSRV